MTEFLAANWLWIVLLVAFFALHRSGMGCGMGHGSHGGHDSHGGHSDRPGDEAAAGRSSAERPDDGAGHGGDHRRGTTPAERAPTEGTSGAR